MLEFQAPFSNGMSASLVIGQKDFTSSNTAVSQSGLPSPTGVAFDPAGNLWVTGGDVANRLLEFQPPFRTGMEASLVIGQPDFTTGHASITPNGLSDAKRPGFDSSGNLWVPDLFNGRVLEFTSTPVPEFPTASLAIVALASLAVVAMVSRRFSVTRLGR